MSAEQEFAAEIAEDYVRKGWEVRSEEEALASVGFRPDLLLRRGDEYLVVEIERLGSAPNPKISELRKLVEERLAKAAGNRIRARIEWLPSNSKVFLTKPGPFTDLAVAAIDEVTGRRPALSTTGGTSDARFIASYCPVIEFGLVGQTMHQVDERAAVADIEKLTKVYRRILDRYFA